MSETRQELTTGPGAAALLAAGIGSFALAVFDVIAGQNAHTKKMFNWYNPSGPLVGVSTAAILVWLLSWAVLHSAWRGKAVGLRPVGWVAMLLLLVAIVLTFPPIAEHL